MLNSLLGYQLYGEMFGQALHRAWQNHDDVVSGASQVQHTNSTYKFHGWVRRGQDRVQIGPKVLFRAQGGRLLLRQDSPAHNNSRYLPPLKLGDMMSSMMFY